MKFKKPLTIGVIYTTVLFSLLQITGVITRPLGLVIRTYTLTDTYYIKGFDMKWAAFFDTGHAYNEFLLIVFLALSVIFLIREKNEHIFNFLSLTWIALLIFFLPELFTYRNYQVLTPLLAITFAYLIDKLSTQKTLFKRPKND